MKKNSLSEKLGKYDYRIIFLLALLAFGNLAGALQPVRIFGLCCAPYVCYRLFSRRMTKQQQWVGIFFGLWLCYAVLSFLWTPDKGQGLKEIIYFFVHFNLFFLLAFWAQKAHNPLKAILLGWGAVLILTLPIALYEIITYNHLPVSRFAEGRMINLGGQIIKQRFASVTFGNRNTYVVLVVYCLPFLFANLMRVKKMKQKVLNWIILLTAAIVLTINASRGGILCLIICSATFFYFSMKGQKLRFKNIAVFFIIGVAAIFFISQHAETIFRVIAFRSEATNDPMQNNPRIYLWGVAFALLGRSLLMGTGVGSEHAAMATLSNGITAVHNMVFEVLMQYGLLVFVFFCIFLFKVFFRIRIVKNKAVKYILWAFLLAFIPLFIINSGYLLMPSLWLLFASLFVLGTDKKILALSKNV